MQFQSQSFEDTVKFGEKLGCSLRGGEVIILSGVLGSGKTAFTKGIALGIGIRETVTSPSFSILNEYKGEIDLYHFDFYRIDDSTEMEDLFEDYIYKDRGVVVIEWGDSILQSIQDYIYIQFKLTDSGRVISIERRNG
jgi:tRNA threonylcarbamoyladenosine biosynthesis protein TsaE